MARKASGETAKRKTTQKTAQAVEAEVKETEMPVQEAVEAQETDEVQDAIEAEETIEAEEIVEAEETVDVQEAAETAPAPQIQTVVYTNAGDQMMTLVHLYTQRTPVTYGNGKKKVFNRFGEKFSISVREFEQEFAPSPVGEALLKQKIIAVGEDCPQEVRDRLDIDYDGELLTLGIYKKLLTLPTEEICAVFESLCKEHKELVVRFFADDFDSNQGRNCQRDKIKALNDVSKKYVEDGQHGMFAGLLRAITDNEEY